MNECLVVATRACQQTSLASSKVALSTKREVNDKLKFKELGVNKQIGKVKT
jgi:hypothetical protein